MTTQPKSNEPPKIYSALLSIMQEVGAIGKDSQAGDGGFKFQYRGIDTVMAHLYPLFVKHRVFILPEVVSTERREYSEEKRGKDGKPYLVMKFYERSVIRYTFVAEDGSSVTTSIPGEGMDQGDKASNKALSVALRYCLTQMFLIPTSEEKDPERDSHKVSGRAQSQPAQPVQSKAASQESFDRLGSLLLHDLITPTEREATDKWMNEKVRSEDAIQTMIGRIEGYIAERSQAA